MCDQQEMKAQSCLKEELARVKGLTLVEFGASGDCCREAATGKSQTHSEGLGEKRTSKPAAERLQWVQLGQILVAAKPRTSDYFVNCCPKSWAPDETLINLHQ